jgi:hypothetical protein
LTVSHCEADLHTEDEECGNQRPGCVHRIDDVVPLEDRVGRKDFMAEETRLEVEGRCNNKSKTSQLAAKQYQPVATPLGILQAIDQPGNLAFRHGRATSASEQASQRESREIHCDDAEKQDQRGVSSHCSSPSDLPRGISYCAQAGR